MMSKVTTRQTIGRTSLSVTSLGLGCAPLGNMFAALSPGAAEATLDAALNAGIRYFDTAPSYGFGLSETRLGYALKQAWRADIVISSKVGYSLLPADPSVVRSRLWVDPPSMRTEYDFSRDAVLRSVEASLERLGTSHIDMIAIHDPDEVVDVCGGADPYARSHFKAAMDGAYAVLAELRSQGVIKAVGVGMNQWQMLCDFARAGDFDYFLLAGRYTLLDQDSLAHLLPLCSDRRISIIVGAPYNSGILATGAVAGATFNYRAATPAVLDKVRKVEAVCGRHRVSLQAAALQFPLRHPMVASTIPGARSIEEMKTSVKLLCEHIPDAFWDELKSERLIEQNSPVTATREGDAQ